MLCVTNRMVVPVRPELADQLLHVAARAGIERAEGFVHQQDSRPRHERLGDRHALLHAAGELVRVFAGVALAQADAAQVVERFVPQFAAAAVEARRESAEQAELADLRARR